MPTPDPETVTHLLSRAGDDAQAAEELLPLVYDQLRKLAERRMTDERSAHTLQATALVHEAYVRMVGGQDVGWANRAHFYSAAAEAMRRILIDHARRRGRKKRGGDRQRVPLNVLELAAEADSEEILALDAALGRLESADARAAEVVRLRFFAGLGIDETAKVLEVSRRSVQREWSFARAWLFRELQEEAD